MSNEVFHKHVFKKMNNVMQLCRIFKLKYNMIAETLFVWFITPHLGLLCLSEKHRPAIKLAQGEERQGRNNCNAFCFYRVSKREEIHTKKASVFLY